MQDTHVRRSLTGTDSTNLLQLGAAILRAEGLSAAAKQRTERLSAQQRPLRGDQQRPHHEPLVPSRTPPRAGASAADVNQSTDSGTSTATEKTSNITLPDCATTAKQSSTVRTHNSIARSHREGHILLKSHSMMMRRGQLCSQPIRPHSSTRSHRESSSMAVVRPPPLTRDQRLDISEAVLNHCPIKIADLILDRARETRGLLRAHHLPADATSAELMRQAEHAVVRLKSTATAARTFPTGVKEYLSSIIADPTLKAAAASLEATIFAELRGIIRDRTSLIRKTALHHARNPSDVAPSVAAHDSTVNIFATTPAIRHIIVEYDDVLQTVTATLFTRLQAYVDPSTPLPCQPPNPLEARVGWGQLRSLSMRHPRAETIPMLETKAGAHPSSVTQKDQTTTAMHSGNPLGLRSNNANTQAQCGAHPSSVTQKDQTTTAMHSGNPLGLHTNNANTPAQCGEHPSNMALPDRIMTAMRSASNAQCLRTNNDSDTQTQRGANPSNCEAHHHPLANQPARRESTEISDWQIDSRCTDHMTPHYEDFVEGVNTCETTVEFANGAKVPVERRGTVKVVVQDIFDANHRVVLLLENVLHVPGLNRRFLSVRGWNSAGGSLHFLPDRCRMAFPPDDTAGHNKLSVDVGFPPATPAFVIGQNDGGRKE
jgi:hypothetical protein